MATEQGNVFESRIEQDGSFQTQALLNQPLESADREHPGPLVITSLAIVENKIFAGSLSRGVLAIEDGLAREIETRPAVFFVRALEADRNGKLWLGTRVKKDEPGLFTGQRASPSSRGMKLKPAPLPTSATSAEMFGLPPTAAACFFFRKAKRCSGSRLTARPAVCVQIMSTRSSRIAKT